MLALARRAAPAEPDAQSPEHALPRRDAETNLCFLGLITMFDYIFAHATPEVVPFLVFALAGGAVPLPLTVRSCWLSISARQLALARIS